MRIGYAHYDDGYAMMNAVFDLHAPKRAANLSVNGDLLDKARAADINLSAALERALAESLRSRQREQWLAENRLAIEAYNRQVESHGVFSDGVRGF